MSYGLTLTTPPTSEPLSVATLKQHLRLSVSTDDSLLAIYISTARTLVEEWTGRQLLPATYTLYLDDWGQWASLFGWSIGSTYAPMQFQNAYWLNRPLLLPKSPCTAVNSIQYYDSNGVLQTLSPSSYVVDTTRDPARILLTSWPSLDYNLVPRIQIQFAAGYTSVPTPLLHLVMLLASDFYRQREATTDLKLADMPYGFRALLNSYKVFDFSDYGTNHA